MSVDKSHTGNENPEKLNEQQRYPLTAAQKGIWITSRINENTIAYNLPNLYHLNGSIDPAILKNALGLIFKRHPLLNALFSFENGTPFYTLQTEQNIELKEYDLSGLDKDEIKVRIQKDTINDARTGFDIKNGPLYRFSFYSAGDSESYFYTNFHHLVFDGTSYGIFIRELNLIYGDLSNRYNNTLPEIKFRPESVIKKSLSKEKENRLKDYWRNYLEGVPMQTEFPYDRIRSQMPEGKGGNIELIINEQLTAQINKLANQYGYSAYKVLLSAYAVLISKYSRNKDLCIGIPVTNRITRERRPMIGMFVNMMPMRFQLNEKLTFREMLDICSKDVQNALSNQDLTFEGVIELLNPKRNLLVNPLFQLSFSWTGKFQSDFQESGLQWQKESIDESNAAFDVNLYLGEHDRTIEGRLNYSEDILDRRSMESFRDNFIELVKTLVLDPDADVNKIHFLTASDKKNLTEWNDTDLPYEDDLCIHKKFEKQVLLTPDNVALYTDEGNLTYKEFNVQANRLAHHLISEGVGIESKVSVCIDRSSEMMIAIFAILKAGGLYVPFDPTFPQERIDSILEDADPVMILLNKKYADRISGDIKQIHIDSVAKAPLSDNPSNPEVAVSSRNLAYILYTSGSTGKPKGVGIEHHSVLNLLAWKQKDYPLEHSDIIMQKTPITFDVSVPEFFWWSFTGSGLMLLPHGAEKEPEKLIEYVEKYKVTVMQFVPSNLGTFVGHLDAFQLSEQIRSLKLIFVIGEALPGKMVHEFYTIIGPSGKTDVVNLYGPTEATVEVSDYVCPRGLPMETVSIGKPIHNSKIFIVDEQHKLLPIGVPGELVITGVNLARGYLNRDELNKEKFITIDLPDGTQTRAYKTGDLAKWKQDGKLYFIGRVDNQVKVSGYRIELGDIESKIQEIKGIDTCAVIVDKSNQHNHQLSAYLFFKEGQALSISDVKKILSGKLPEYMVPSKFMILDELPQTASGKLNRKALPEIRESVKEITAPIGVGIESILSDVWKTVLNLETIGMDSNFFDIGGSSILVPKIISILKKEHDIELRTLDIFNYPTIRTLASFMEPEKAVQKSSLERKVQDTTDIAIVGLAGRFPGADNIEEYWENLLAGEETIKVFSDEEMEKSDPDYAEYKDKDNFIKARGVISDIENWDAKFFSTTAKEAKHTDPQHRVWLETVWHGLEDAGCDPFNYDGRIGVFAGTSMNTYLLNNLISDPKIYKDYIRSRTADSFQVYLGNDPTYLPGRTAYLFNFKGPAINVQTACSTSLVAVAQACDSLHKGESDIGLAGGVTIKVPQENGYLYYESGIKSPDGHCRPFDKNAQGTVFSNGVGVVVLKRLDDAIRDRNRIYSVIKGYAINNDGNGKVGFTAPSVEGQQKAISEARTFANIPAGSFDYIEAHGTATPFGDPIEFQAVEKSFRQESQEKQFCGIGSVKGNIGHLDAAAGIAGLIKIALSTYHKVIPPSINYSEPNPLLNIEQSPFYVVDKLERRSDEKPLTMGVSSFGVGGTNAHVIIQGHTPQEDTERDASERPYIYPVSAKSEFSLEKGIEQLSEHIGSGRNSQKDIAYTLQKGRHHMPFRSFGISTVGDQSASPSFLRATEAADSAHLTFMFPGQGAQYISMGADLYAKETVFRATCDECFDIYTKETGGDLKSLIFNSEQTENSGSKLAITEYTQPALFVIEYALAKLYMHYGIVPEYLVGHSIGEYTAACVSGVFDLEAALKIVIKRGQLMQGMPAGDMMAVKISEEELIKMQNEISFEIAAVNSLEMITISVRTENIKAVTDALNDQKISFIKLDTSHAFHSSDFDPILSEFESYVNSFERNQPAIPFISCLTGKFIQDSEATSASYWAKQLRNSVRFNDGITELSSIDNNILLEVGPNTHLSGLARQNTGVKVISAIIASIGKPKEKDEQVNFYRSIGALWQHGLDIDFSLYKGNKPKLVSIPKYVFDKKRYWVDAIPTQFAEVSSGQTKLKEEEENETNIVQEGEADKADLYQQLHIIWTELLGEDKIGPDDDFYLMGGHSLLAIQIISRIKEILNIEISLEDFLNNTSLKNLETFILDSGSTPGIARSNDKQKESLHELDLSGELTISPSQERMWIINKLVGNPAYNLPISYRLKGNIQIDLLKQSLEFVFNRHIILKSYIRSTGAGPKAYIDKETSVELTLKDLSMFKDDNLEDEIQDFLKRETRTMFDIEHGPLYRIYLVNLGEDDYILHFTIHHIVFDGWSQGVLIKELNEIYNSLLAKKDITLPALEQNYFSFSKEIREFDSKERYSKSAEYWKSKLSGIKGLISLPLDSDREEIPSGEGGRVSWEISKELTDTIKEFCRNENVTPYMLLLSVFGVLIGRYSNENDICIGSPVANRMESKHEKMIGLFINSIVQRIQFDECDDFKSLLMKQKTSTIEALTHQDYPFENLVEQLHTERFLNINPIFQLMFAWQNSPREFLSFDGTQVERVHQERGVASLDLTLFGWEDGGNFLGNFQYNSKIFKRDTIIRLRDSFIQLIQTLIQSPDLPICNLPIVTRQEQDLISKVNATDRYYPRDKTIVDLFEQKVTEFGKKDAVVFKDQKYSYDELNSRSNQLARFLIENGASQGTRIGILVDKSLEMMVGVLAVLKTGASYIPIDPEYPEQRIAFIIEDSECEMILTQAHHLSLLPKGLNILDLNDGDIYSGDQTNPEKVNSSSDVAAIIYTSGTTGVPKGSMIRHFSAVRLVYDPSYMELNADDKLLYTSAFVFDVTTYEIWSMLLNGGTLHIVEKETILKPETIGEEISKHGITILHLTSALFTELASRRTDIFAPLKYLLIGGDVLSVPHVNKVRADLPDLKVINCYGPSENTTYSTTFLIEENFKHNIPIGKPINNSTAYIFDKHMNHQPIGVLGDLYVGGDGLSKAYLKRDELNKTRFVTHPKTGERLYNSGDLARWLPDGNIEFQGRVDNQIKIRGFRIELEEIEAVINEIEGVVECVVKPVEFEERDRRLVAFISIPPSIALKDSDISERIKSKLPVYMVPSAYNYMEEFPRTINGKIDRNSLTFTYSDLRIDPNIQDENLSETEQKVKDIWMDVLKSREIGLNDNFFDIGGNSLLAISMVEKFEQAFELSIALRLFFDSPTIAEFSRYIDVLLNNNSNAVQDDGNSDSVIIEGEI